VKYIKIIFVNLLLILLTIVMVESYLAWNEYDREFGSAGRVTSSSGNANSSTHIITTEKYPVSLYPNETYVFADLEKQNIKGVKRFSPGALVLNNLDGIKFQENNIFPFTGVSKTKTVYCNESSFWVTYDSDEHGFRNKLGTWEGSIRDGLDIALLGDSFTQGACVEDKDVFSSKISEKGMSVINLGVGGTGPLIQYGIFREYVSQLKPKKMLWMFFAEDIRDGFTEAKNNLLSKYVEDENFSQNLINRQNFIDQTLQYYYEKRYPEMLLKMSDEREKRRYIVTYKIVAKALELYFTKKMILSLFKDNSVKEGNEREKLKIFETVLLKMNEDLKKWGGEMVFVYIPTWIKYASIKDSYGVPVQENYLLKNDILNIVKKTNIKIIDLDADLLGKMKSPEEMYNNNKYGHFHPSAYSEIGEYITSRLNKL
jgi:hypothetical protein